jgi:nitroreductase
MDAIEVLTQRVSPAQLTGPGPSAAEIETMLAAAASAPDHGRMQPWRFLLIEGDARPRFGELLAQSLLRREPDAPAAKLEAERKKALRAPLIVVVAAVLRESPKVPVVEQVVAAGAAATNMQLAAHALGFGAFWRTGGPAYDPEIKRSLGLAEEDAIIGFIYVGSIGIPGKPRQLEVAPVTQRW